MKRWLIMLAVCLSPVVAQAAEPVDLALVLVTDVSRSIDDSEYDLEKQGVAAALLNPTVLAAIKAGAIGSIAVAYIEFAGDTQVREVIDFTVIRDAASARGFTDRLLAEPRSFYGRTAISSGIDAAVAMLSTDRLQAQRRVIDVCGDGTNNAGRDITAARDDAVKQGIIINGLTIINDHPVNYTYAHVAPPGGLTNWYRDHVIGGLGSFVREVHDFHGFGDAMTHKLINEIAAINPSRPTGSHG
jgi:hypothetical protein